MRGIGEREVGNAPEAALQTCSRLFGEGNANVLRKSDRIRNEGSVIRGTFLWMGGKKSGRGDVKLIAAGSLLWTGGGRRGVSPSLSLERELGGLDHCNRARGNFPADKPRKEGRKERERRSPRDDYDIRKPPTTPQTPTVSSGQGCSTWRGERKKEEKG